MVDHLPAPSLGVQLRTRALWVLMRVAGSERLLRLHRAGRLRLVERALLRGELSILGGVVPRLRLAGVHFAPWGAQAYGVLTGTHESMVQEALRRSLAAGMVFVDVGANLGATSLLAASLVGPTGRVVSLDAQRECVDALEENARRNGFSQMTALHAAVGSTSGPAEVVVVADTLWTRLAGVGDHPLEVRRDVVRGVTLDELVATGEVPLPDVVKVDVEGAELEVLAGMQELIARAQPLVLCEMHGKNAAWVAAMEAVGYRVVDLDAPGAVTSGHPNTHTWCEPRADRVRGGT